jgi:hypothetical protein
MCSPVKFAHSLSKKSQIVSSWELCIICQISSDDTLRQAKRVWLTISDKLKWPHRYKNWYKAILNSTQNKNKVYHKTNLNNNIKLQVFRTIYRTKLFPEHFMSIPVMITNHSKRYKYNLKTAIFRNHWLIKFMNVFVLVTFPCINFTLRYCNRKKLSHSSKKCSVII